MYVWATVGYHGHKTHKVHTAWGWLYNGRKRWMRERSTQRRHHRTRLPLSQSLLLPLLLKELLNSKKQHQRLLHLLRPTQSLDLLFICSQFRRDDFTCWTESKDVIRCADFACPVYTRAGLGVGVECADVGLDAVDVAAPTEIGWEGREVPCPAPTG